MAGGIFGWAAPLFALEARRWNESDAEAFARWLRPSVPPGGRVLDLGGGTGKLAALMAGELRCTVTVLDASPSMLRYASRLPGVTAVLGDATDIPFGEASFDAVLVIDAFHHFVQQHHAAREIARVLTQDGRVLVAELDARQRGVRAGASWERFLGEPGGFLAPDDLASIFTSAGIDGEVHPQGGASYVFVGLRSG